MRIKKKTSVMMLTASAVAAVGVAAVSFAAWQNTQNGLTADASTGVVSFFGFGADVIDSSLSATDGFKLVPFDQPAGTYATDGENKSATMVSFAIPDYYVYQNYTVDANLTSEVEGTFYVMWAEAGASVTAPVTEADLAGWTALTAGSDVNLLNATEVDSSATVSGTVLYVVLDSDSANEGTVSKNFSIAITLTTADHNA